MRSDKKKRLEKAGWKVGGARDFLGLTEEEAALVELRIELAGLLRERRLGQDLTQAQVAARIRSSQSRVAKMEAGDPAVSTDLLLRALFSLGVDHKALARRIAGIRPTRGRQPA